MPPSESTALKSSYAAQNDELETDEKPWPFTPPRFRHPQKLRWYHWLMVAVLDVLGPFSTDSYLPNMPDMQIEFGTTEFMSGLTLQVNWLVFAVAVIVVGQLADQPAVGRRGVVLGALTVYVVACVGCATSHSVEWLIFARALQAVGMASCVVSTAIACDALVDTDERMRMLALLNSLQPIAIVSAPALGGLVGDAYGWRLVFFVLAAIGVVLFFCVYFLLPETLPTGKDASARDAGDEEVPKAPSDTLKDSSGTGVYGRSSSACAPFCNLLRRLIWEEREARGCIGVFVLGFCAVFSMLANISELLETAPVSLPHVQSSLVIGSVPLAIMAASACVAGISKFLGSPAAISILHMAIILIFISALILFVVGSGVFPEVVWSCWWFVMIPLYIFNFAQGLSIAPTITLYMDPFNDCAGIASGLRNSLQTVGSSLASAVSTEVYTATGPAGFYIYMGAWLLAASVWGWLHLGFPKCGSSGELRSATATGTATPEPSMAR